MFGPPLAGRTPALQQNWQSSENSQHLKEKTQYLMNTLYKTSLQELQTRPILLAKGRKEGRTKDIGKGRTDLENGERGW